MRRPGCNVAAYWLMCAMAMGGVTGYAQQAVPRPTAPVPLVPAPEADPKVNADRSTTFDLLMPHAGKVELQVEGFPTTFAMVPDAANAGHWTYTVPPLAPEYYSYSFLVDGVNVVDPHNVVVKPSAFRVQSVFHIAGGEPWDDADVPHGVVRKYEYTSAIAKRSATYHVYTPPGYDPKKKYPVLYLLHGYSDEDWAWTEMGKANTIFDNLLAQGKMKPMIVVMPLGYGDMDMIRRGWIAWQDHDLVRRNFDLFGKALCTEVMPRVNAEYAILPGRENHAIAGLSMGGAETLLVGLNHPEDFAWIGAFSAGGLGTEFPSLFPNITPQTGPKLNSSLRLFWVSCGTEDGLLDPNRKMIAWLQAAGVQPKAVETPGMHAWMVWRDNLSHFAPLLFQSK